MFPGQYYEKRQRARKILKITVVSAVILCLLGFAAILYLNRDDTAEVTKELPVNPIVTRGSTIVEIKKLYRCGHMKTEIIDMPEQLMNKTTDEISEIMPKWHILKLTTELLTVEEKFETECDNHFLIKLSKNRLQAVKTNQPTVIYKEMTILTNILTKEDIDILSAGIEATSEYELLEIFESFSELN